GGGEPTVPLMTDVPPAGGDEGFFHHFASGAGYPSLEIPPVLLTVAEAGHGIRELVQAADSHFGDLSATGFLMARRQENIAYELKDGLSRSLLKGLENRELSLLLSDLAKSAIEKKISYHDALGQLCKALGV
ncbi:MAG: hypothetical protein FWG66_01525, partial [Spirochaetes bacterium]|nr:hypothetical protein [Spirochaetota bacterium]